MRYMILILALFTAPLMANESNTPVTIEWERPTARVDGIPLPASEISHYELGCAGDPDENYQPVLQIPGGDTETFETTRIGFLPAYGEYRCALRVFATDNSRSYWSNEVQISWAPAAPLAPVIRLIIN